MATYTQPAGTTLNKYFEDIAVNPINLASGALKARLDPRRYPQLGVKFASTPDATSVSPASVSVAGAPVTTDIVVSGANLLDGSAVTFSGSGVTVNSTHDFGSLEHQLTVNITVAGNATAGTRDIIVTNPDGGTDTLTAGFTVALTSATVTLIAPNTGAAAGGDAIVLTGTGLTGSTGVTFGGVAGTSFSVVSATSVHVTTPAHAAGAVDVVLQHPAGNVTTTGGFTYA